MATYMHLQDLQPTIVGECTSSIQETLSEGKQEIVYQTKTLIQEDSVKLPNTESIPSYEIPTTPRGYCIIIDNTENNMFGGDEENEKLTRCLEESLAFHVEHFTRLNIKSIHRLLQHLSKVDHSSYSCLMVIVFGRGRNGFLYGHDNKLIEFHEIMSYFTPERCTTLEGKPKLFLFQTVNDGTESKEIRFHTELTDSYQAFCELSLSAVLRNTSFVHKLFEDAVQNRGVDVDDVLKQDASLMTYSSLNGKKLFLPTLQNTNVTVKRECLLLELKMAKEVWNPIRESTISDISSQENKDTLNKITKDIRKGKISGSSISIIGGLIAIIGFALISVTFAGSIVLSVFGTFVALYGAFISVTATVVKFRLQKQILNEAKEAIVIDKQLWEIVEKLVRKCNQMSEESLENFDIEEISVIGRSVFRTIAHLGIVAAQGVQITRSGGLIATHTIRIASTALRTIAIVGIVTTILILPFDILELIFNACRLRHGKESKTVLELSKITNELQNQLDKVQDELRERKHEIMITMSGEQETDGGKADKAELSTCTTQVTMQDIYSYWSMPELESTTLVKAHAHVVDETLFSLTGDEECTLDWPEYGIHIDVPEGSLFPGVKTDVQVKAIVAGDFILPHECHLASGIYQIICPEKFQKKVTFYVTHAAIIESQEEALYFRFYAAKCSSGPPYQFKELHGGIFTPFSESASIQLYQFSFITIGASKPISQRYSSQVFYKLKQPYSEWEMFFVVIKDDPAFEKFIRDKYDDCSRGVDQILKLKKDATFIKLQHDSSSLVHWEMTKMIAPEIGKDDIDCFSPEHTLSVPHCHFHFCWKSELPLQPLNMKIRLVGADRPNNFFQGVPESNLIPFNYHMTF